MGKGQKRKNAGVGVDFRRVKHKVGKKLPKAQNETDTSFKSRSITLPEQSALQDKAGAAVTHRNLTLKELLGQCGHYSEKVRREALQGLGELLAAHPQELPRHTTLVMETLAERITDGDKGVRGALRDMLRAPVLPAMGASALGPFVPLLMAHVCSAMTHLADPVRADALRFLDLLADWRPDLIASSFLAPALQHFGDLLSKGARGRSLAAGSLAALLRTVAALERFLQRVCSSSSSGGGSSGGGGGGGGGGTAVGSSGRGGAAEGGAAAAALGPSGAAGGHVPAAPQLPLLRARCGWPPLAGGLGVAPGAAAEGGAGGGGGGAAAKEEAARRLLGHLSDCWSDCGPAQLAQAPELTLAQCLLHTLRSCNHLLQRWGPGLSGDPADRGSLAYGLLKRVAPVFPVHRPAGPPPPAATCEAMVQLNVAAAQLLVRFLPAQLASACADPGAGAGGGGWTGRLLDWFEGVMRQDSGALPSEDGDVGALALSTEHFSGEHAASEQRQQQGDQGPLGEKKGGSSRKGSRRGAAKAEQGGGGSAGQQPRQQQPLPAEVYAAALEGVGAVLPLVAAARRRALLGAVWALWERSGVRSATRVQVLRFWRRLLADPAGTFYTPLPPAGEPLVLPGEALQCLQAMPRFLWELGSKSGGGGSSGSAGAGAMAQTTEAALRLLLDGARYACCGLPGTAGNDGGGGAAAALQQQLAPLFATLLPAPAPGAAARLLPGPLARLPPGVQGLAVDVLWHLPSLQESTLRTAALLCLTAAYPKPTALRLLEVVASKAASEAQQPGKGPGSAGAGGGFGGLLLCVLSGCSQAGAERAQRQEEATWRRHEAVVGGACQALLGCGLAGPLAEALAPPLLDLCQSSGSARPLHGALAMGAALAAAGRSQAAQLVPPALAAELPAAMLCHAALCDAAAAAATDEDGRVAADAAQAEQRGGGAEREWLPPAPEALALGARVLSALPSLLPATLDCVAATLGALRQQQAEQEMGAAPGAAGAAAAGSPGASSRLVSAWLGLPQPAGAAGAGARGEHPMAPAAAAAAAAPPAASWVGTAVQLLQGVLGAGGEQQEWLVEEGEERAEAALAACEQAVADLEAREHPTASRLRHAVAAARAVFANLFGRGL